ncbi:MAG: hypothetical protein KAV87_46670, partial [Desulfobacteraceae bacterium]|nr:hypothetical protein [Desulfobacteraceae bacterium]
MITKMFDAIEEVLQSLDVGGEQSRQFAALKSVIGYPGPPEDVLDEIERRGLLVRKLRMLAVEAEGLA